MPQFDFYSFAIQNFWFLPFLIFSFLITLHFLIHIAEMLKLRNKIQLKFKKSNAQSINIYEIYLSQILKNNFKNFKDES